MGLEIFLSGFWFGFISCIVFCFTLGRISRNRGRRGERNRPLDTFPDAAQSDLNAAQIFRRSRRAWLFFIFWILVLAIEVLVFALMFERRWYYFLDFC